MVYDTSVDRQEIARAKAHVWDLQCEGSGTLSPCAICYDYDSQPVLKMFLWLGFLVWFGFWGFFVCLFLFWYGLFSLCSPDYPEFTRLPSNSEIYLSVSSKYWD